VQVTERQSVIELADPAIFGAWFKRIQGQRTGPESALAADCLSFLSLSTIVLDIADLYGANFLRASLPHLSAHYAVLSTADLSEADLRGCTLRGSILPEAPRLAHAAPS
jgi:uncharacterized protein YjbI with pentapeptide repeats